MSKSTKSDTLFARTLPPDSKRAERVGGLPRPSLLTRLWFGWALVWISLMTIPFSLVQLVTHHWWPTTRNFRRWASRWGRTILAGIGVRTRVDDRACFEEDRPCIFVANHQNLLDILVLAAALPYPFGFLSKQELARVPFLGFAIRHSPSIFIDRSTLRTTVKSLKDAAARIQDGHSVLFYAEGARSYSPVVYPFMKGAFHLAVEAGVPLVPVTIKDSYRRMDERSYAARPGPIHITVGEPISMEGATRDDLPDIMAIVRAHMEDELEEERRRASVAD